VRINWFEINHIFTFSVVRTKYDSRELFMYDYFLSHCFLVRANSFQTSVIRINRYLKYVHYGPIPISRPKRIYGHAHTHPFLVQRAHVRYVCRLNYIGTLLFFTELLLVSGVGAGGAGSGGRPNAFNHLERKIWQHIFYWEKIQERFFGKTLKESGFLY